MISVNEVTKNFKENQASIQQGDIVRLRPGGIGLAEAEDFYGAPAIEDGVDYTVAGIDKDGDLLIIADLGRYAAPYCYPSYLFVVTKSKVGDEVVFTPEGLDRGAEASWYSAPAPDNGSRNKSINAARHRQFKVGDEVVVTAEGHARGVEANWYGAPALEIGSRHKLMKVGSKSVRIDLGNRPELRVSTAYYNPEVFELVDDAKETENVSDKLLVRDYIIKQLEKENYELRDKLGILQENFLVFEQKQKEDAAALFGLREAIESALNTLGNAPHK